MNSDFAKISADIEPGKYIIAVSGGVDSMALLDILSKKEDIKLIVAHFNHGMRPDANKDENLVKKAAKNHRLVIEVGHGNLGPGASEEAARIARYNFLESVRKKYKAEKIITAHHQDDLIETAIINILRGTGRRGVSAIADNPLVLRPLLNIPKSGVLDYAKINNIKWREDTTNKDTKYLRNHIRKNILPLLPERQKKEFIKNIHKIKTGNKIANELIATISQSIDIKGKINRYKFTMLPTDIARELVVYWLRQKSAAEYDKKTIERLVMAIKTARAGTKHNVKNELKLVVDNKIAFFTRTE